jgi:ribosomal protein S18 acetylase RimI-like enzyme
MAAALVRRGAADQDGSIRPTNLARDLYQIAELVEIAFESDLDANGRASIQEMKALGRMGPLLWLFSFLEPVGMGLGLGQGYVWRINGRVVGNVSIHSGGVHPWLGRGFLIANVAVHPSQRRKGIARLLMQASMEMIERSMHGQWVALEVDADNTGAVRLYEELGFQAFETLNHWELSYGLRSNAVDRPSGLWAVRQREPSDAANEIDLIFNRARVGGMAWTQTLTQHDVQGSLFSQLMSYAGSSRYVLPDPAQPADLLGEVWIETSGWRHTRVSLFLDPALTDASGRQALIRYALNDPELDGRLMRVETITGDQPVEDLLINAGFRKARSLTQMRYHFGDT